MKMIKKLIIWFKSIFCPRPKKEIKRIEYPRYYLSNFDLEIIKVINEYRISLGLNPCIASPVRWNDIAYNHIEFMQKEGKISHDNFSTREQQILLDKPNTVVGEIIGYNFSTANAYLQAWKKSKYHNRTMVGSFIHISVASSENRDYIICLFTK